MKQKWFETLPLKQSGKFLFWMTVLITVLITSTSIFSILNADLVYPTEALNLAFYPSDMVNLLIGLPLLLITMLLLLRGQLAGLLCWPGALFFVIYSYGLYLFGLPFGILFLPYLLIMSISIFTLIGVAANMDAEAVKNRLNGHVPVKFTAGVMIALALMLVFREASLIFSALSAGMNVERVDYALWIVDFMIGSPPLLIVGIMLWRRRAFGFAGGAGLLLQYGLLSLGLIPVMYYQANLTGGKVDVAGIIIVLVMALICLIPFAYFIKAAQKNYQLDKQ